jgi:hypothetical protein
MGAMNVYDTPSVTSTLSQRARGKHDLTAFSLERLDERNRWDVILKFTRNWAAPWSRRETRGAQPLFSGPHHETLRRSFAETPSRSRA